MQQVFTRPLVDPAMALCYHMPPPPLLPPDSEFNLAWSENGAYECRGWRTRSGHVLVKPLIDGQECGYMLLDTVRRSKARMSGRT
jgi:hypothetical protein